MKKRNGLLWGIIVFILVLAGCGQGQDSARNEIGLDKDEEILSEQIALNTKITLKPSLVTDYPDATFAFKCTSPPCVFKCKLDAKPWKKCKSPKTYQGLREGTHTFKVKAGKNGVWDPSPAKYNWTIDLSDVWLPISGAPWGTYGHSSVWTGTEMIVWGGEEDWVFPLLNTGFRYNPVTDSWTSTTTTNAPTARRGHTAVWTGTKMIVWGGESDGGDEKTGGIYNPAKDSWTIISTNNAPMERVDHRAIWTGTEMIVWGGYNNGYSLYLDTGGRYNPVTNSWAPISTTNAPSARRNHTAVWTGTEMIVWGGNNDVWGNNYNTGGRYNPVTDSWTSTTTTNAPTGRSGHTAVWTGTEMIVWGGYKYPNYFNTGGRYNPVTNSWAPISTTNAPSARRNHTAVWTGTEMIVWGGDDGEWWLSTGGKYNPITDSWTPTTTNNAPSGRESDCSAVWTGTELIIWGGGGSYGLNSGGRYYP